MGHYEDSSAQAYETQLSTEANKHKYYYMYYMIMPQLSEISSAFLIFLNLVFYTSSFST